MFPEKTKILTASFAKWLLMLFGSILFGMCGKLLADPAQPKPIYSAYLFVYFTGNDKRQESIHFALSADSYHYQALNHYQAVISSELISATGGVRDPHILRGADHKSFYMVATDMVSANGWNSNRGMVLLKSTDLIHWTSRQVNIPHDFPQFANVNRVWAPQTIYDPVTGQYMVYFSMRAGNEPDKIYYAYANKDFSALATTPKQLFYNPSGGACIDGDIIEKDGKYHLFFKTENAGGGHQDRSIGTTDNGVCATGQVCATNH